MTTAIVCDDSDDSFIHNIVNQLPSDCIAVYRECSCQSC